MPKVDKLTLKQIKIIHLRDECKFTFLQISTLLGTRQSGVITSYQRGKRMQKILDRKNKNLCQNQD